MHRETNKIMSEKVTTPTQRLIEASTRFDTEDERKAFIEGANYILDNFEHWSTGLWSSWKNPDEPLHYGWQVANDIKERCLPMFRNVEYKQQKQ